MAGYDVCNGHANASGITTLQITVGSGSVGSPQGTSSGDLVAVYCNQASGLTVINVTDTKSNAYTQAVTDATTNQVGAIWTSKTTAALVSGTDKITVTYSANLGQANVIAKGYPGVSSGTVDQTAHNGASSNAPGSTATGPLNQTNELILSMIGNANSGGSPTGLSWGGSGETIHNSSTGPFLTVFDETVSATAALTASGTLPNGNANWCCLVATFKLSNSGPLTITSTSPPADNVGNDYNGGLGYTLTATGGTGTGYTWSFKSGQFPPGEQLSSGLGGGHICGNSIKLNGATTSSEQAAYTNWNTKASSGGLGLYTAQSRKIYFLSPNGSGSPGSFPTNATAALWESNNADVGVCLTMGMGMFLCFRPIATGSYNDPGWPGGSVFATPAQVATDYASMKATIQSIQSACASVANGASVLGIILWQENDNKNGFPGAQTQGGTSYNAFVASHVYYAYYPLLKADFPHLDVLMSYVNYPHGTPAQDATDRMQRFPGPHPLNPSGWGTALVNGQSTNLFCDGITTDEYCDGAYGEDPDGTVTTNPPTGRLRYMYAEPDMYTPATPTAPASGNPGWADVADFNGISWGNLETGNNASQGNPDIARMQAYLVGIPISNPAPLPGPNGGAGGPGDTMVHSMLQVYQTRVANGDPIIGMHWYENLSNTTSGFNDIVSSTDQRIPWLNMIDAATAQSTGAVIGGTLTKDTTVTYPHTYSAVIQVKDSAGTKATATLNFVISLGTVTLKATTSSLQTGTAGQSYSQQLANNGGGTGTGYTWSLNAGSLAGSGISLSSGGLLSGSNPVAGTYTGLQFKVTDSGSNTALTATMTLTVNAASSLIQITNTSPLPAGTTGATYADFINMINGVGGPYTVILTTGSILPPGLVIVNTQEIDDQAGNDLQGEDTVDITQEA